MPNQLALPPPPIDNTKRGTYHFIQIKLSFAGLKTPTVSRCLQDILDHPELSHAI